MRKYTSPRRKIEDHSSNYPKPRSVAPSTSGLVDLHPTKLKAMYVECQYPCLDSRYLPFPPRSVYNRPRIPTESIIYPLYCKRGTLPDDVLYLLRASKACLFRVRLLFLSRGALGRHSAYLLAPGLICLARMERGKGCLECLPHPRLARPFKKSVYRSTGWRL